MVNRAALASMACLLVAAVAPLAHAQTYHADLDAENQVPPISGFSGSGSCTTYPINSTTWGYNVTIVDVPDLTLAHFHMGNATTSGPVVIPLLMLAVPITIEGEAIISSTYTAKQFAGPLAGKTFGDLVSAIDEDLIYCNVHNKEYPEGIIRGQVV